MPESLPTSSWDTESCSTVARGNRSRLFALWQVPGLWARFTLLEAGQLDSWLAKWVSPALLGLGGLGFACWGVWQILPAKK
jgi:hypothetical protein